jgi:hypothetical protein
MMGLIGSMLALTGCWGGNSWHQKLTVTVDTPTGPVSGSAVSAVDFTLREDALWMTTGTAYGAKYAGEAVSVEVAPGKYLFALLDERLKTLAINVFVDAYAAANPKKEDVNKVEATRATKPLNPEDYPLLVTFTDINDPKSVKEVKPGKVSDAFGAGYSLKSITLEITEEAVTDGRVFEVLPWSKLLAGSIGKDMKLPYEHLLNQINDGSFHRGN